MASGEVDALVRAAAFAFLERETSLHGETMAREALLRGFVFAGRRVPLAGPPGIFKPAVLPLMPLSITTVPVVEGRPRPYEDEIDGAGLLAYRYRGTDPGHADNVGLRLAMQRRAPLLYLYGLVRSRYLPIWPVHVVADDPERLCFSVSVEEARTLTALPGGELISADVRRAYTTGMVRRRLHQEAFRQRVLVAYQQCCAICRLRHDELLQAAHILPDGHPRGEPIVPNGLALCSLHHAAFDRHILGIRPDLRVDVRLDVLREEDGPMLLHGLQAFHGGTIAVPRRIELRPNPAFLSERYDLFRRAG